MLFIISHLYVYHMCTRALHISSQVGNRSIVDLFWQQFGRQGHAKCHPGDARTHCQGLIMSQQLTMRVNSWHTRPLKQPTQKSCPSLVTFKPILMKYAAQKYGWEKTACKRTICIVFCIVFCACEAGPACLKQLTKRSWRR